MSPSSCRIGVRPTGHETLSGEDGRELRRLGGLRPGEGGPGRCLSGAAGGPGEGAGGAAVGACVLGEGLAFSS